MNTRQRNNSQQQLLDECNVFVKYLPPDLSDQEFYKLFKTYGTIVSSKIMVDQGTGKSLGYGFVRYNNSQASQKAIRAMNGQRVSNKRLLCKLANLSPSSYSSEFSYHPVLSSQTPSDNLYIKPLLKDTSEEDLRALFGKFGAIVDCKVMIDRNTGLSRQIGFVRFEDKGVACLAIEEMNNYKLDPSAPPLTVKYADTKDQKNARKALRQKQNSKGERYGSPSSPPSQTTYYYYQPTYGTYGYPPYQGFNYLSSEFPPYSPTTYQSPPYSPYPYSDITYPNGATYYNYEENGYVTEPVFSLDPNINGQYYNELQFSYVYPPDSESYYFEGYENVSETPNGNTESPEIKNDEESHIDEIPELLNSDNSGLVVTASLPIEL